MCKLVVQTGCANWLCKLVVQTLCANSMCKLYVQTGWANWLGKLVGQTLCAKLYVQTLCANSMCKLLCANWSCSSPLMESCTSAPGGLHECSWSSSSSFFTLGLGTWGVGPRVGGMWHAPTPYHMFPPLPHLFVHALGLTPYYISRPSPHAPTPCHHPCHMSPHPVTCLHTLPHGSHPCRMSPSMHRSDPLPHAPTPCHMPPHPATYPPGPATYPQPLAPHPMSPNPK